jgi:DNA-binding NtrC family response regulator
MNVETQEFTAEAMERLCAYHWPGNVRELRNVVERMLVLHGRDEHIDAGHLPSEFQFKSDTIRTRIGLNGQPSLAQAVESFERALVCEALKEANGVQTRAAELLGTTRRILKYRMDKLQITPAETT